MAPYTECSAASTIFRSRLLSGKNRKETDLVALPGLEPGLFALRGRRVNQLHHNAKRKEPLCCNGLSIAEFASVFCGEQATAKAKYRVSLLRCAPVEMT